MNIQALTPHTIVMPCLQDAPIRSLNVNLYPPFLLGTVEQIVPKFGMSVSCDGKDWNDDNRPENEPV